MSDQNKQKNYSWVTILIILFILLFSAYQLYHQDYFSQTDNSEELTKEKELLEEKEKSEESNPNKLLTIKNIEDTDVGKQITVTGIIRDTRKSKDEEHLFITLVDVEKHEILVSIFSSMNISHSKFIIGEKIQVTGSIEKYKNQFEIIPQKKSDIVFLESKKIETNRDSDGIQDNLGEITEAHIDEEVRVRGQIVSKYQHEDGHLFLSVKLGSEQEVQIPLFSSLQADENDYPENTVIEVQGKVNSYQGNLQVIPYALANIEIIEKAMAKDYKKLAIAQINENNKNDYVQIEGIVNDIFITDSDDIFFDVLDDTGTIKAVQFRSNTIALPGRKEVIDSSYKQKTGIYIQGRVNIYEQDLEIIVEQVWAK